MSETHLSTGNHKSELYEIRFKGHLDAHWWADRFEGLSFTHKSDGTTVLSGPVIDQAALHGLLRGLRDLGLPLISVIKVDPKQANEPNINSDTDPKKETNA